MAREFHYCENCNHKTTIVGSNRADAERKLSWWSRTKPLCWECQKLAEREAATEKAADMELPPLHGSYNEVTAAENIRTRLIPMMASAAAYEEPERYNEHQAQLSELAKDLGPGKFEAALAYMVSNTNAGWWCSHARDLPFDLIRHLCYRVEHAAHQEVEHLPVELAWEEATIRPAGDVETETVAVFEAQPKGFDVKMQEKNETFRLSIKQFGAVWDADRWVWSIKVAADQIQSIMIEVGAYLLNKGFVIRIHDADIRASIIAGNINESDGKRVDYAGDEKLRIDWRRIDGDFYEKVRKIKGSVWSKPLQTVLVPITSADEVRDFAESYGFSVSDIATSAMDAFDEYRRTGMVSVGKKRDKGAAERILDITAFPQTIEIPTSLRD